MKKGSLYQFRMKPAATGNVDAEKRMIQDVILAEVGEAKGHGFSVEAEFLQDFVRLAKRRFKKGLPVNYDHSFSTLGRKLGRIQNLRIEDDVRLIGDLHFYQAADQSPDHPGGASYILAMAAEDPESVMMSLKFVADYHYQRDGNGQKVRVWYWEKGKGWINEITEFGPVYVKLKEPRSADVVGDGALTSTMFNAGDFFRQVDQASQDPAFENFIRAAFPLQDATFLDHIKEFFNPQIETMAENTTDQETTDQETTDQETTDQETTDQETTDLSALRAELEALKTKVTDQERTIAELSGEAETTPTGGEMEQETTDDEGDIWMNNPIYLKAQNFKQNTD